MYVYHACICVHVYVCIYIYIYACVCVCVYVHVYICVCVCGRIYFPSLENILHNIFPLRVLTSVASKSPRDAPLQ